MLVRLCVSLLLALALPAAALAQEPFPSKPITMVVPFPPGGQADLSARPLAAALPSSVRLPTRPSWSGWARSSGTTLSVQSANQLTGLRVIATWPIRPSPTDQ